jgi:hypothetical protein
LPSELRRVIVPARLKDTTMAKGKDDERKKDGLLALLMLRAGKRRTDAGKSGKDAKKDD